MKWSFLSSTYQYNRSQLTCVEEEEIGMKTCDVTFSHCSSPAIHRSSCILKSLHHCSLVTSLEALHVFVNVSWKQYWQYILSVQALLEQCSIAHRDPRIFIKPCSLIVGCSAACCLVFKDLLLWSSDSITGFALIICKYDSAAEWIVSGFLDLRVCQLKQWL